MIRKYPFNDYVSLRVRHSFVLESWGDYVISDPLASYLPDSIRGKFPGDATIRITVELVRPATKREQCKQPGR